MTVPYDRDDVIDVIDELTDPTADGLHHIAAAINRLANEVGAVAYAVNDLIHAVSHSERSSDR